MNWSQIEEQLIRGARLVYTDVIPGGWTLALHYPPRRGRSRLVQVSFDLPAEKWFEVVQRVGRFEGSVRGRRGSASVPAA